MLNHSRCVLYLLMGLPHVLLADDAATYLVRATTEAVAVTDQSQRDVLLQQIVDAYASAGLKEEAESAAVRFWRLGATEPLVQLLVMQVANDRAEHALRLLDAIGDDARKEVAISAVMIAQARNGDTKGARVTARRLPEDSIGVSLLHEVEAAVEVAEGRRALASLINANDPEARQSWLLAEVAWQHMRLGDLPAAQEVTERLPVGIGAVRALCRLARDSRWDAGDGSLRAITASAVERASKLQEPTERALALYMVANLQATIGQRASARKSLQRAEEAIESMPSPHWSHPELEYYRVRARLALGDYAAARKQIADSVSPDLLLVMEVAAEMGAQEGSDAVEAFIHSRHTRQERAAVLIGAAIGARDKRGGHLDL